MLAPYMVAVFLYYIAQYRCFNWNEYKDYVLRFDISGPHYYALLYIQLILISPVLYYFLEKAEGRRLYPLFCLLGVAFLAVTSYFLNVYTDINGVYGGGGRLLGGSYILVLYLGMIFGKHYKQVEKMEKKYRIILALLLSICAIVIAYALCRWGFVLDGRELLGSTLNPPGLTLMVYATSLMLSIYFIDGVIPQSRILTMITKPIMWIGRNTLYIFLYHLLCLSIIESKFSFIYEWAGPEIKALVLYAGMIIGSMLLGFMYRFFEKLLKDSYSYLASEGS